MRVVGHLTPQNWNSLRSRDCAPFPLLAACIRLRFRVQLTDGQRSLRRVGRCHWQRSCNPRLITLRMDFRSARKLASRGKASAAMLAQHPDTAKTYLTNGKAPKPGEIFCQPNFARTLQLIAEGGRDAFYHGEIADKIVQFSDENGGLFTRQDFADHKSDWVEPISTNYRGYDVYEIPPNGQGIAALLALNIVEGFDLGAMGYNSPEHLHYAIEAMKLGFADLYKYVTDPAFVDVPVAGLLSDDYTESQRSPYLT